MSQQVKIFSGTASKGLSEKIANSYGVGLGNVNITHFSDGEFQPEIKESIRGSFVFIIQSTNPRLLPQTITIQKLSTGWFITQVNFFDAPAFCNQ